MFSHLRRGVTRFAIPRERISHNGSEKKNGNAGGDSMHAGMAQQLQRTCAGTSRIIAGEIAPIRGVDALRYKTKPFEVMIRSP
jgi:hypothetical protein